MEDANYTYALVQGKALLTVTEKSEIKVEFVNEDGSSKSDQDPLLFWVLPLKAMHVEILVGFDKDQLTKEQIERMGGTPFIEVIRTSMNQRGMNPIPPPRGAVIWPDPATPQKD